ncbi:alpha/beta hydrolase [Olsenella sp. AM39-30AC]|uniref:alpha/beta hydrolase n=1 Tax=Olsenella sp. AM39-30AC TaxID=2292360 RepID=UPI000E48A2ED|nr:alpha/beta hydrolase [Olsenella sp. AM39-30AC]RHB56300.1 alpha/beta hydrolase [Olsenella sp. AM39-30AC]
MVEQSFEVEGEKVTLRATEPPASTTDAWTRVPVVYLHVFEGNGADVWQRLRKGSEQPMALVAVAPKSWDNDLTPWPAPPVFRGGRAYEGAAAAQLALLGREIMPWTEALLAQHGMAPSFSALAGYSLAGLFTAWAATQCSLFERIASVSGSLWYPDFVKYVAANRPNPCVRCAYFSLGDAEPRTRNRAMRSVLEDTRQVPERFEQAGVVTRFELNPGNHFMDEDLRTARGIRWLLEDGTNAAQVD